MLPEPSKKIKLKSLLNFSEGCTLKILFMLWDNEKYQLQSIGTLNKTVYSITHFYEKIV